MTTFSKIALAATAVLAFGSAAQAADAIVMAGCRAWNIG